MAGLCRRRAEGTEDFLPAWVQYGTPLGTTHEPHDWGHKDPMLLQSLFRYIDPKLINPKP